MARNTGRGSRAAREYGHPWQFQKIKLRGGRFGHRTWWERLRAALGLGAE